MKQQKHALYLMAANGAAELVPADEVDDKLAAGYSYPVGRKANGAAWNAECDLPGQDAAARLASSGGEPEPEPKPKPKAYKKK